MDISHTIIEERDMKKENKQRCYVGKNEGSSKLCVGLVCPTDSENSNNAAAPVNPHAGSMDSCHREQTCRDELGLRQDTGLRNDRKVLAIIRKCINLE